MKQLWILIVTLLLCTIACGRGNHSQSPVAVESEILRFESGKWHPSSLGGGEEYTALFADDFVTVEFGADLHGGVERKFNANTVMSGPEGVKFRQFLDQTHFELSHWRFIHVNSTGVVVSYRVSAPSLRWKAFATSVWAKRGDQWKTVFYQASTAK